MFLYSSAGEYEIYIKESSAMMFYGMERLLAYLPPAKVAALNLSGENPTVQVDQPLLPY